MSSLRVCLVCTDPAHPVIPHLRAWCAHSASVRPSGHFGLVHRLDDAQGGDLLVLVSCSEIARPSVIARYAKVLVIHASDLPRGRGWSPMIWQIIDGANEITVSLIEACEPVDSGPIWHQKKIRLNGHELVDELNTLLFEAEVELIEFAVQHWRSVNPRVQADEPASSYRRRTPQDSQLDPYQSLAEQFDLLRVCDPVRYPAYFDLRGHRYAITLRKLDKPEDES